MGWRRLAVDLLDACQDFPDAAAFDGFVLQRMQAILGFDSAIIVSRATGAPLAHVNKRPYLHHLRRMAGDRSRYQTAFLPDASLRDVYLDTEVFSLRERTTLPFYVDVVRPQGISAQICARAGFRNQPRSVMYLCRHDGARFRERDLDGLRRVMPLIGLAGAALESRPPLAPALELSRRERQIVGLLCRGFRNQDIAEVLGTSPNTVRNQLQRLFEKTRVANRAELVAAFLRHQES